MTTQPAWDLIGAITAALRAGDMPAVVTLVERLAIEDPKAAENILAVVQIALGRRP